jgi:hypothetical protein
MQQCRNKLALASFLWIACVTPARADEPEEPLALGLSPEAPPLGGFLTPMNQSTGGGMNLGQFTLHGFFRAPMVIGLGPRTDGMPGQGALTVGGGSGPMPGQSGLNVHAPPLVPDGNYVNWAFTNNVTGPWAQLNFTFTAQRLAATVILAAYNLTDAGWRNLNAQLGFNQAYVTLNLSGLVKRVRATWTVGAFSNGYGAGGIYDAGRYNTYIIGRTHVAGETLSGSVDLGHGYALLLDQGFGAKLDVEPFSPPPSNPLLPYPGPVQQGTTLLNHAHVGIGWKRRLLLAFHYLEAWTQDARATPTDPDGRIRVLGADFRVDGSVAGDGYLGYSQVTADHALPVADALEVIHSLNGWELRDNYLGPNSQATGTITSLMLQHTVSVARILRRPNPFWGEGPDLLISVFGMFNYVASLDPMFDGVMKLKAGAEVTYLPLKWFGASLRYDAVFPDLSNTDSSFHAISPKLVFRTSFLSHEQIVFSYTRYLYGNAVTPTYPYQMLPPDKDVLQLAATVWF